MKLISLFLVLLIAFPFGGAAQINKPLEGYYIDKNEQQYTGIIFIDKIKNHLIYQSKPTATKQEIAFDNVSEVHFPDKAHYLIFPIQIGLEKDFIVAEQVIQGVVNFYQVKDAERELHYYLKKGDKLVKINPHNPKGTLRGFLEDCPITNRQLSDPTIRISNGLKSIYKVITAYHDCKGVKQTAYIKPYRVRFEGGINLGFFTGKMELPDGNIPPYEFLEDTPYQAATIGIALNWRLSQHIYLGTGLEYSQRKINNIYESTDNKEVFLDFNYWHIPARLTYRKQWKQLGFNLNVAPTLLVAIGDNWMGRDTINVYNFSEVALNMTYGGGLEYDLSDKYRIGFYYQKAKIDPTSQSNGGRHAFVIFREHHLKLGITQLLFK